MELTIQQVADKLEVVLKVTFCAELWGNLLYDKKELYHRHHSIFVSKQVTPKLITRSTDFTRHKLAILDGIN